MVAAVLSGNRNFEGRINPQVKANYLASPPLVVAYALAGTMDIDLAHDPLGTDPAGQPVYLRDIWPIATRKCERRCASPIDQRDVPHGIRQAFDGDANWQGMSGSRPAISTSGTS